MKSNVIELICYGAAAVLFVVAALTDTAKAIAAGLALVAIGLFIQAT